MDNKITLQRLKTFFIYDSIKLLACVIGVVFFLVIVFNAIAKKPTSGQDYFVMVADNVYIGNDGYNFVHKVNGNEVDNYGFSYDILRVNNMVIDPTGYSSGYLMNTYAELNEDDVFIVADVEGSTMYDNYINSYFAVGINDYIESALKYVTSNGFISETGVVNEEKIRSNFIKTRGEDTRFETEKLFNEGLNNEVNRIKAIYKNANILKQVLLNHPELYHETEQIIYNNEVIFEGVFGLKLSALPGKGDNKITNMYYRAITVDANAGIVDYTAEGIVLLVGNNYSSEGDLFFENLAYINSLINTYSSFIDELDPTYV